MGIKTETIKISNHITILDPCNYNKKNNIVIQLKPGLYSIIIEQMRSEHNKPKKITFINKKYMKSKLKKEKFNKLLTVDTAQVLFLFKPVKKKLTKKYLLVGTYLESLLHEQRSLKNKATLQKLETLIKKSLHQKKEKNQIDFKELQANIKNQILLIERNSTKVNQLFFNSYDLKGNPISKTKIEKSNDLLEVCFSNSMNKDYYGLTDFGLISSTLCGDGVFEITVEKNTKNEIVKFSVDFNKIPN